MSYDVMYCGTCRRPPDVQTAIHEAGTPPQAAVWIRCPACGFESHRVGLLATVNEWNERQRERWDLPRRTFGRPAREIPYSPAGAGFDIRDAHQRGRFTHASTSWQDGDGSGKSGDGDWSGVVVRHGFFRPERGGTN